MSESSIAFAVGFFVGACLMVIIIGGIMCIRCAQCTKEHEHEVRIHDSE